MTERWKPVARCGGRYQVSDRGRVRSVAVATPIKSLELVIIFEPDGRRRVRSAPKTYEVQRRRRYRVLRPKTANNGYLQVRLRTDKGFEMLLVHRLVLQAFVGAPPSAIHQGDHINGARADNRLQNLRWLTPIENARAAHRRLAELRPSL